MYAVRSAWAGLPAIIQKDNSSELSASVDAVVKDGEEFGLLAELLPSNFNINAGFVLTDPQDPRYQAITKQRAHFGRVIHTAAVTLRGTVGGEDHIDCVISVTKAIEIYLLEYGVHKSNFLALVKNLLLAQEYYPVSSHSISFPLILHLLARCASGLVKKRTRDLFS